MPNHCYQQVRIEGPHYLVSMLYNGLTENGYDPRNGGRALNPQFCQLVVPMPFEQWQAPKAKWQGFEVEGWYDWRVNNWGTKWDVCEVEIDEEIANDQGRFLFDADTKSWFEFRCWTAWGPPVPVWDKLHELGVKVHATYQDEGGMFEGEYIDGSDSTWEPEFEEEEAC
jgi:hypothetical protein